MASLSTFHRGCVASALGFPLAAKELFTQAITEATTSQNTSTLRLATAGLARVALACNDASTALKVLNSLPCPGSDAKTRLRPLSGPLDLNSLDLPLVADVLTRATVLRALGDEGEANRFVTLLNVLSPNISGPFSDDIRNVQSTQPKSMDHEPTAAAAVGATDQAGSSSRPDDKTTPSEPLRITAVKPPTHSVPAKPSKPVTAPSAAPFPPSPASKSKLESESRSKRPLAYEPVDFGYSKAATHDELPPLPSDLRTGAAGVPYVFTSRTLTHDWYDGKDSVTVDLYAKDLNPDTVTVTFTPTSVKISIKDPGRSIDFDWTGALSYEIVPAASSYKVLRTKVEVVLAKLQPGLPWRELEGTKAELGHTAPPSEGKAGVSTTVSVVAPSDWRKIAAKHP